MANINIKLSEEEVHKIIMDTIRDKFNISPRIKLDLTWSDDSGVVISTPDTPIDQSTSWLDD